MHRGHWGARQGGAARAREKCKTTQKTLFKKKCESSPPNLNKKPFSPQRIKTPKNGYRITSPRCNLARFRATFTEKRYPLRGMDEFSRRWLQNFCEKRPCWLSTKTSLGLYGILRARFLTRARWSGSKLSRRTEPPAASAITRSE